MQIFLKSLVFLLYITVASGAEVAGVKQDVESKYHEAQREFQKDNFSKSLKLFEDYIKVEKSGFQSKDRLFWVIDQVGYIHLRVNNDPVNAIKFYKSYESDLRLDEAQQDTIAEWIGAAKDWEKEKLKPQKLTSANQLFSLGKKYFEKGIRRKKYPMDNRGNADLSIAESYLRPFVIRHDTDKRISQVLVMMGRIKFNLRTDSDYWSENFYLKEAIRRSPGTDLAKEAWKKLNEDVRIGYTGSAGENTPESVKKMLEQYRQRAFMKKPTLKQKG